MTACAEHESWRRGRGSCEPHTVCSAAMRCIQEVPKVVACTLPAEVSCTVVRSRHSHHQRQATWCGAPSLTWPIQARSGACAISPSPLPPFPSPQPQPPLREVQVLIASALPAARPAVLPGADHAWLRPPRGPFQAVLRAQAVHPPPVAHRGGSCPFQLSHESRRAKSQALPRRFHPERTADWQGRPPRFRETWISEHQASDQPAGALAVQRPAALCVQQRPTSPDLP
mmetsp:Transcript_35582/g.93385  ORF Transcript_35582/g.93385 Transcript_35582/m.93385 type:complete len:228 (-) Transcript_35582:82-765(-)